MDYRQLGRSGLRVSPLCLGAMMFGGATDEPTSARIIGRAREFYLKNNWAAVRSRVRYDPHPGWYTNALLATPVD
jgi:hypothetical protein